MAMKRSSGVGSPRVTVEAQVALPSPLDAPSDTGGAASSMGTVIPPPVDEMPPVSVPTVLSPPPPFELVLPPSGSAAPVVAARSSGGLFELHPPPKIPNAKVEIMMGSERLGRRMEYLRVRRSRRATRPGRSAQTPSFGGSY